MSEPTLQELKELIISSRQDLELKLSELDKKVETGLIKLESEIKRVEGILSAKMDGIDNPRCLWCVNLRSRHWCHKILLFS